MKLMERTGEPALAEELAVLLEEFYRQGDLAVSYIEDKETYAKKIAEHAVVFFAMERETVTGFCALYVNRPPRGFLTFYGVLPAFRGQGIGNELMSCAVRAAQANGCSLLDARVDQQNPTSRKALEFAGFHVVCEEENPLLLRWEQARE